MKAWEVKLLSEGKRMVKIIGGRPVKVYCMHTTSVEGYTYEFINGHVITATGPIVHVIEETANGLWYSALVKDNAADFWRAKLVQSINIILNDEPEADKKKSEVINLMCRDTSKYAIGFPYYHSTNVDYWLYLPKPEKAGKLGTPVDDNTKITTILQMWSLRDTSELKLKGQVIAGFAIDSNNNIRLFTAAIEPETYDYNYDLWANGPDCWCEYEVRWEAKILDSTVVGKSNEIKNAQVLAEFIGKPNPNVTISNGTIRYYAKHESADGAKCAACDIAKLF